MYLVFLPNIYYSVLC